MSDQALEFDRARQFELRRERLLKVAAGCFNGKGFSGMSLRDIADRLNISDPAIYHYVKGKEELVFLCYERALALIEESVRRARAEGRTGLDRLRHYIEYHVAGLCGPSGPIAVLSEVAALSDPHQRAILERLEATSREIIAFIAEGIADGSVRPCDPEVAARAVTGAINWIPRWYAIAIQAEPGVEIRTSLMSRIENIAVTPADAPARVIVNARTGTGVINGAVRISAAAVSHGRLTVSVQENPRVVQPAPFSRGRTAVEQDSDIQVTEQRSPMFNFEPGASLAEIVRAVNAIGAAPSDLVAILEALKQAGALRAELVIL